MRGADSEGDTKKGHPSPLDIFLSSILDTQIPTAKRVQALVQSWLGTTGSDQPQLANTSRQPMLYHQWSLCCS
ncbi:hypothetical protein NC652_000720 [Populus alba x Populus x berolinensis]|nr:hypothetical protein NC652_000720 [Populus alba x Populus x berolinensis]